MIRAFAIVIGLALIAIAFIAASNVADTRPGQIAEVVTLFAGLAGVGALLYGLVPKRTGRTQGPARNPARPVSNPSRTANDLLIGGGGLVVAVILLGGLLWSGGWGWALIGLVLLLPMVAGSVYLVTVFVRARDRDWRIDLRRLAGR